MIKFCLFRLIQVVRKRADKIFGKSISKHLVTLFTEFWFETTKFNNLFYNLEVIFLIYTINKNNFKKLIYNFAKIIILFCISI